MKHKNWKKFRKSKYLTISFLAVASLTLGMLAWNLGHKPRLDLARYPTSARCLDGITNDQARVFLAQLRHINQTYFSGQYSVKQRDSELNTLLQQVNPEEDPQAAVLLKALAAFQNDKDIQTKIQQMVIKQIRGEEVPLTDQERLYELGEQDPPTYLETHANRLRPSYQVLVDQGAQFVSEEGWDFSHFEFNANTLKQKEGAPLLLAFEIFLTPEIAAQLANPNRYDPIVWGNQVFLPPIKEMPVFQGASPIALDKQQDPASFGKVTVRSLEAYDQVVQADLTLFMDSAEKLTQAIGEGATYKNIFRAHGFKHRGVLDKMVNLFMASNDLEGKTKPDYLVPIYTQNIVQAHNRLLLGWGVSENLAQELSYIIDEINTHRITLAEVRATRTKLIGDTVLNLAILVATYGAGYLVAAPAQGLTYARYAASPTWRTAAQMGMFILGFGAGTLAVKASYYSKVHGGNWFCHLAEDFGDIALGSLYMMPMMMAIPMGGAALGGATRAIVAASMSAESAAILSPILVATATNTYHIGIATAFTAHMALNGIENWRTCHQKLKYAKMLLETVDYMDETQYNRLWGDASSKCLDAGIDLAFAALGSVAIVKTGATGYRRPFEQAARAQAVLETFPKRSLPLRKIDTIHHAYESYQGKKGPNGKPADIHNLTPSQEMTKNKILSDAGFTPEQIRILDAMEMQARGLTPTEVAVATSTEPSTRTRSEPKPSQPADKTTSQTPADATTWAETSKIRNISAAELQDSTPSLLKGRPRNAAELPGYYEHAGKNLTHDQRIELVKYLEKFSENPAQADAFVRQRYGQNRVLNENHLGVSRNVEDCLRILAEDQTSNLTSGGREVHGPALMKLTRDMIARMEPAAPGLENAHSLIIRLATELYYYSANPFAFERPIRSQPSRAQYLYDYVEAVATSPARQQILSDPQWINLVDRMLRGGDFLRTNGELPFEALFPEELGGGGGALGVPYTRERAAIPKGPPQPQANPANPFQLKDVLLEFIERQTEKASQGDATAAEAAQTAHDVGNYYFKAQQDAARQSAFTPMENSFRDWERTTDPLDSQGTAEPRPRTKITDANELPTAVEPAARIAQAEAILERPLSQPQQQAVQRAHEAQTLAEKSKILEEAGMNRTERRKLIEAYVVGTKPSAKQMEALWIKSKTETLSLEEIEQGVNSLDIPPELKKEFKAAVHKGAESWESRGEGSSQSRFIYYVGKLVGRWAGNKNVAEALPKLEREIREAIDGGLDVGNYPDVARSAFPEYFYSNGKRLLDIHRKAIGQNIRGGETLSIAEINETIDLLDIPDALKTEFKQAIQDGIAATPGYQEEMSFYVGSMAGSENRPNLLAGVESSIRANIPNIRQGLNRRADARKLVVRHEHESKPVAVLDPTTGSRLDALWTKSKSGLSVEEIQETINLLDIPAELKVKFMQSFHSELSARTSQSPRLGDAYPFEVGRLVGRWAGNKNAQAPEIAKEVESSIERRTGRINPGIQSLFPEHVSLQEQRLIELARKARGGPGAGAPKKTALTPQEMHEIVDLQNLSEPLKIELKTAITEGLSQSSRSDYPNILSKYMGDFAASQLAPSELGLFIRSVLPKIREGRLTPDD